MGLDKRVIKKVIETADPVIAKLPDESGDEIAEHTAAFFAEAERQVTDEVRGYIDEQVSAIEQFVEPTSVTRRARTGRSRSWPRPGRRSAVTSAPSSRRSPLPGRADGADRAGGACGRVGGAGRRGKRGTGSMGRTGQHG